MTAGGLFCLRHGTNLYVVCAMYSVACLAWLRGDILGRSAAGIENVTAKEARIDRAPEESS